MLNDFRKGLEAIGDELVEKEEISGEDVARLVDGAMGRECANSVSASDLNKA